MHLPRWAILTAVFFLLIGGPATAADSGYELSMDTAVEVPERTVENPENESEVFTITTVGRTAPGERALVDVSPPSDTRYSVYFREEDGDIVDFADRIQGDQQIEFAVGSEPAGSYVITAGETSAPDAVLPVVIEGYVVDMLELDGEPLAGSTIDADSSHNVTVKLTDQGDVSVSEVTLTLWVPGEGVAYETALAETEADALTFSGSIEGLDADEYNAQVRIQGGQTVNGNAELIGLSDNQLLIVESHSSDDGDETGDGSSTDDESGSDTGTNAGDGESADNNTTGTDTTAENESPTNGTDTDGANSTDGSSNNTNSTGDNSSTPDTDDSTDPQPPNGTDDSTDTDAVIEPNTNNSDSNTNDSSPLYAVPLTLAFVVVAALMRRLSHVFRRN